MTERTDREQALESQGWVPAETGEILTWEPGTERDGELIGSRHSAKFPESLLWDVRLPDGRTECWAGTSVLSDKLSKVQLGQLVHVRCTDWTKPKGSGQPYLDFVVLYQPAPRK